MSKQGAKPVSLAPPSADMPGITAETVEFYDLTIEHASEVHEFLARHDKEGLGRSHVFDGNGARSVWPPPALDPDSLDNGAWSVWPQG